MEDLHFEEVEVGHSTFSGSRDRTPVTTEVDWEKVRLSRESGGYHHLSYSSTVPFLVCWTTCGVGWATISLF